MGLIRFAVRQCAARAVRGVTLAEDRVFLSAIDPLDTKVRATLAPMLIVNTDDHKQDGHGRDMTGGTHQLSLVIEAAIASRVTAEGKDEDGGTVQVTIIEADAGLDLTLDLIEHQILRALTGPGPWADLFRRFVTTISSRLSRRGADVSGTRWAARQITFTCDTLAEPVGFSEAELSPGSVWADFLAAMEGDENLAPIAPLIRGALEGDARDWMRGAAMLGISEDIAVEAGFAPLVTDGGQPVTVEDIRLMEGEI